MVKNILYIIISISTLIGTVLSIISIIRNRYDGNKIFETREFWAYKIRTIEGLLFIIIFGEVLIQFIFSKANYSNDIKLLEITFLIVYFSVYVECPRRLIVNAKGFYYMTRFKGLKLICGFNQMENYNISDNGKMELYFRDKLGSKTYERLRGRLNEKEIKKMGEILNDRNIVEKII